MKITKSKRQGMTLQTLAIIMVPLGGVVSLAFIAAAAYVVMLAIQ